MYIPYQALHVVHISNTVKGPHCDKDIAPRLDVGSNLVKPRRVSVSNESLVKDGEPFDALLENDGELVDVGG